MKRRSITPILSLFAIAILSTALAQNDQLSQTSVPAHPLLDYRLELKGATGSNECYLIERSGILYVTTSSDQIMAIRAKTGATLWSYQPTLHAISYLPRINRGVAVSGHTVYALTTDDHLLALNALTGSVRFQVPVADPNAGYFESMVPLVADHTVVVGSAGGDQGVRGFVAAYNAQDGRLLWRFYTVPQRGHSWLPARGFHGGGTVWMPPVYDAKLGLIWFGTGNPSPDYYGISRPGPDPYTDSVVALHLQNGHLLWFRQEVMHDVWDYDVASPPLLFPYKTTLAVGEAGKDGYWYEWNAKTGKTLVPPVAFVREGHRPPTPAGVLEWPGAEGGANYGPSAYDSRLGLVYVSGINGAEILRSGNQQHGEGDEDAGTGQNPEAASAFTGTITAIHTISGHIAWQLKLSSPAIGGVTVTTSGTLYFGTELGRLVAVSAKTGHLLWQIDVGAPIADAPILYRRNGVQYLAVVTGGAESLAGLFPYRGPDQLLVYRLL